MSKCIGITRRGEKCYRFVGEGSFCSRHKHQEGSCLVNYHTHAHKCANKPLKNGYCKEHQHLAKGIFSIDFNALSIVGKLLALGFAVIIALSSFVMVSLIF